jgi:hypothetical protein
MLIPVRPLLLLVASWAAVAGAQLGPSVFAVAGSVRPEPRVALVIGNSKYTAGSLAHPADQARAMGKALESCGFRVIRRTNSGKKGIEAAVRELARRLRSKGGVGVLYYAGHSLQVEGRAYLVPVDARILDETSVASSCVEVAGLLSALEEAGNRLNVVFLDACQEGPYAAALPHGQSGLGQIAVPPNCRLALAAQPGRNTPADSQARGLYTGALLKYLRAPGLELEDLFRYVRRDVRDATSKQQMPWESAPQPGRFYFMPVRWDASSGPPPPEPLEVGPEHLYSLAVRLGSMWPQAGDLGQTFSQTDAGLISEPAPLFELRFRRRLEDFQAPDLGFSLLLAWPKSRAAAYLPAGHEGFLTGVVAGAEWDLPMGWAAHNPYLSAGAGAWFLKFSGTPARQALDLNPAARLGIGTRVQTFAQGLLRVEAAYLPLKGPNYLVNSASLALDYAFLF